MDHIYMLRGIVQQGRKRGVKLGFPTANIVLNREVPDGIYASEVVLDGMTYQAATFIGAAKTFGETEKKAESYLLDFTQDIYGKEITIRLYKKHRDNMTFSSAETMIRQIRKDISQIREYFRKNEKKISQQKIS
jgi:riboflavin kinase / FMN adenylyltransferase